MELIEFGKLSQARYAELVGDEPDPWSAGDLDLEWRPKDRHVALRDEDGRLLAAAGLVAADVEFGEHAEPVEIVGIGGVIVAAAHRGHGLGKRVITEILERAQSLGPGIALLFCQPDRAGLYRRHGFAEVPRPVLVDQPSGQIEMPMVTMWRPLREDVNLPAGPVKINGLPF